MQRILKRFLILIFLILVMIPVSGNQEYYRILSNSRAEPMSMGGSYFAHRDDFNFIMWNPAAFVLDTDPKRDIHFRMNVSLFFRNLVVFATEEADNGLSGNGAVLAALVSSVKGVTYVDKKSGFYAGVILFEEMLSPDDLYWDALKYGESTTKYRKWLNGNGIMDSYSNHLAVGYPIDKQWNFGYGLHYYRRNFYPEYIDMETETGFGHSFGIHWHDNRSWNVGITYFEMPVNMEDARIRLERIDHKSYNLGISYQIDNNNIVNVGVRDFEKSDRATSKEVHVGAFSRLGRDFCLKAGYFEEADTGNEVWSVGCGIWNLKSKGLKKRYYKHQMRPTPGNYIFNFSYVYESRHDTRYHQNIYYFFSINIDI